MLAYCKDSIRCAQVKFIEETKAVLSIENFIKLNQWNKLGTNQTTKVIQACRNIVKHSLENYFT